MSALEDLLSAAREAEPKALSEESMAELVAGARGGLEATLSRARDAEPDPISDRERDALVDRAAVVGRARHRSWTRHRVLLVSGGVAAFAAAAAVLLAFSLGAPGTSPPSERSAEAPGEPTRLELASGDRLLAGADARFEVESPTAGQRRVRLSAGAMLFDVQRVPGGRFTVVTPTAEVTVLGTVFSVRASARGASVWVYEGVVRVRSGAETHELSAGQSVHLGSPGAADDPLADAGQRAAERRLEGPVAELAEAATPDTPALDRPERRASVEASLPTDTPRARPESRPRERSASMTPVEIRTAIANGRSASALESIRRALGEGRSDPFLLLEGDALRALGRDREAARAYGRAAARLPAPRRQQAGFLEARLHAARLADPSEALSALQRAGVCEPSSPLQERGLELEVRLRTRLGQTSAACDAAERYLSAYPSGPGASAMRALVEARAQSTSSE